VDYRVILEETARDDTDYLTQLKVPNRQGRLIGLSEVATLRDRQGPATYYHYDGERATMITGDVDEEQITSVQATGSVVNHFNLQEHYPGMRFVIGGEAEETEESFQSLYVAFAIAVVAIFLLLILLFNSVTQPLVIIVAIPFGMLSVIVAFALHAKPLGFLAMMGLVGLAGVVVNDSLVMVHHINGLRKEKSDKSLNEIVSEGAADRLRAILMTTLTTAAGLIPLAYGLGGSDPFVAPLALALGYGLVFATPLTLALIPSLYVIHDDISSLVKRVFQRIHPQKQD
jgi:multidrug efflux pump subunit AcrB